jgi:Xaa-Pro aminopeptidase
MATEVLPDHEALRYGRRERALAAMEAHHLDVLVLGRPANIRYVTGVPLLWNAGTRPFGPGCVLVRSTGDIYLLSTWDEGVPDEIPHERLYGITWDPMNLVSVLRRIGEAVQPRRVGTDAMSPLFALLLPLAFPMAEVVDGGEALQQARRVKTNEEVAAIRAAITIAEAGLAAAITELRPGLSERDLTGVFMDAMAGQGVTTPANQDVVRITTPGRRNGGHVVQSGDLVAFDAGVVAGGYTGEVGRTWLASPKGDASRAAGLFRRWDELWARLAEACQPGVAGSAMFAAYESAGEALPNTPIVHGLGLGFDEPLVVRDLPITAAEQRLEAGAVIVVTGHVRDAEAGAVIGKEAVLITPTGPEVLTSSPVWNA